MYVPQAEAYEEFRTHFKLTPEEDALYRRVLVESDAIDGRYIAMHSRGEVVELDQDELIARFTREGRKLGAEAVRKALDAADCSVDEIDGLIVNTCTGYLCPGLSSFLVEDLGLLSHTHVRDLAGMGCGGALPNLDTAVGLLQNRPGKKVLSVSIEICSATLFMGPSPDLVVSNAIFGDGACAVLIDDLSDPILRFQGFETGIYPEYREDLRYRTEEHRLRNVLSRKVPVIAGQKVAEVLDKLLVNQKLARDEIDYVVLHPGGTQILDRVERDLKIKREDLRESYEILKEYGNMSSPSVIFVLERLIQNRQPTAGKKAVLLSFGAGFSVFATLVEFC